MTENNDHPWIHLWNLVCWSFSVLKSPPQDLRSVSRDPATTTVQRSQRVWFEQFALFWWDLLFWIPNRNGGRNILNMAKTLFGKAKSGRKLTTTWSELDFKSKKKTQSTQRGLWGTRDYPRFAKNCSQALGKMMFLPKDLGPSNGRVWTCIAGIRSSKLPVLRVQWSLGLHVFEFVTLALLLLLVIMATVARFALQGSKVMRAKNLNGELVEHGGFNHLKVYGFSNKESINFMLFQVRFISVFPNLVPFFRWTIQPLNFRKGNELMMFHPMT